MNLVSTLMNAFRRQAEDPDMFAYNARTSTSSISPPPADYVVEQKAQALSLKDRVSLAIGTISLLTPFPR